MCEREREEERVTLILLRVILNASLPLHIQTFVNSFYERENNHLHCSMLRISTRGKSQEIGLVMKSKRKASLFSLANPKCLVHNFDRILLQNGYSYKVNLLCVYI